MLIMKRKLSNSFIPAAACIFAACMVLFPSITESGSKSAIIIWANSIVPILLPFFIFADFIKRTVNPERLPKRIYPFAIAFMSGYPVGAKIVGDFVKNGAMTQKEGESVLSYSLVTGPAFIIGTIGSFLGNYRAAVLVAVSHYAGAVINGCFYSCGRKLGDKADRRIRKTKKARNSEKSVHKQENFILRQSSQADSSLESFTAAISAGFKSMAVILAYLIIFMVAIDLLTASGAFSLIRNETVASTIKGMLEMTAGSSMLGMCNISLRLKSALTAFVISFGGLSVIGQSLSVSGGFISPWQLIKIKLTHGLIAAGIAAAAATFFPM